MNIHRPWIENEMKLAARAVAFCRAAEKLETECYLVYPLLCASS